MIERKIYGIGRIAIETPSKKKPVVLPTLHFMVFEYDNGFEAYCLELNLSSVVIGKSDENAISELNIQISEVLNDIFINDDNYSETLLNIISDNSNYEYWTAYRQVSFKLGLSGVNTDISGKLLSQINDLKDEVDFYQSLLRRINTFNSITKNKDNVLKTKIRQINYEKVA